MNDKEKVRELIGHVQDEGVEYTDFESVYISNDELADYIVRCGVKPCMTSDLIMEEMYDFYQKTVAHIGPSRIDYVDGVYALMDHMARWFEQKESGSHA